MKFEAWKARQKEDGYGGFYDMLDDGEQQRAHRQNVNAIVKARGEYLRKNRKLRVVCLHGSGRDTEYSCGREQSNSMQLLKTGLKPFEKNLDIEHFILRRMDLAPCNGCVSTASTWCHFPCTCWPLDDVTRELYPAIVRSDCILCSTPVYMGGIGSLLSRVIERLISFEGMFYAELPDKGDDETLKREVARERAGDFAYTPRLAGKVCAYFITSKDLGTDLGTDPRGMEHLDYDQLVVGRLKRAFHDFHCVHAEPAAVVAGANPHRPYQYDKAEFSRRVQVHRKAEQVVEAALAKAREIRRRGYRPSRDRVNRT